MKVGRPKGIPCSKLLRKGIRQAGSQSTLARKVNVTRQSISAWKKDIARPSPASYGRLKKYVKA